MSATASHLNLHGYLKRFDDAPLDFWHFGVSRLRSGLSLFAADEPIDEAHLRACNLGTKSETEAAFVLACLQKRQELDGCPLPQWRGPVEGAQLVLDYKQQVLSVQPAYLRVLGKWPHKPRWQGEILSSLSIKPIGAGDDEADWSVLHFLSQENKRSGIGVRADIVAFDEPPVMDILRELRKAGHAGRRSIRLIAETPTIRRQWQGLRDDYGDNPRKKVTRVDQDRAEIRWSLDEVADWIIGPERKAALLRSYQRDPFHKQDRSARWHGDYMDTSGACPFDVDTLLAMRDQCIEPDIVDWPIRTEGESRMHEARIWQVERWGKPERDRRYWMTIDASSGVDDAAHDPFEIELAEIGTGDLVLRTGGYLPGRLVGIMAAGLCRQYNSAIADFETNDRWGVNVMQGLNEAGYSKFSTEPRQLRPGTFEPEPGFHNTARTRPLMIGAIQAWLENWKAGNRYAKCPSKFILNTLLDCILDENGKIVAAPGMHDEALICWGEMLRRAVKRSGVPMQAPVTPAKTVDDRIADIISGRARRNGVPGGVRMVPKGRP